MIITCLVVFFIYLLLLLLAYCKDRNEAKNEHVIPFIGSEDGFFQYEVRVKTGMYPWAGTSAKVGLKILGTQCATKARILQGENCFQRNGLDIFRISLDRRYDQFLHCASSVTSDLFVLYVIYNISTDYLWQMFLSYDKSFCALYSNL